MTDIEKMTDPGIVPEDLVKAVARAIYDLEPLYTPVGQRVGGVEMAHRFAFEDAPYYRQKIAIDAARAAISVLTPLIERATAEKCAEIAESEACIICGVPIGDWSDSALATAAAIRRSFPGGGTVSLEQPTYKGYFS